MTEQEFHQRIKDIVGICDYESIFVKDGRRNIVYLRFIFTHWYRLQGFTLQQIADKLNKDHSTVVHYQKNFDINYEYTKDFRKLADKVLKE